MGVHRDERKTAHGIPKLEKLEDLIMKREFWRGIGTERG
jgi:hypothetical protein